MDENTCSSVVVPAMMQKLPEDFRLTITRGEEFLMWSMEKMLEAFLKELDFREDHFFPVIPSKIGKENCLQGGTTALYTKQDNGNCDFVWANMPTRIVNRLKTRRNVRVFQLNLLDVLNV